MSSSFIAPSHQRWGVRITFLSALLAVPSFLSASYLTGGFGQAPPNGSNGIIAYNTGGANFIDFCPAETTSPGPFAGCNVSSPNSGTGMFTVNGGTGSFASLSGANATILDLTDHNPPAGLFTYFPVGTPVSINNFIQISGSSLNFVATNFLAESCTTTATQACIGGFQFSQVGSNVSVSAVFTGTVTNTDGSGNTSTWTDIVTGQYNNTTMAAVAAAASSSSGIESNTWSGSLTVASPEPSTIALMGGALVGLSLLLSRRQKKA
jgi:hypothetical protein